MKPIRKFIKRTQLKRKARKPSKTLRIFGPPARRVWVRTLPCAACGAEGYSENAHLTPKGEKGTGYRGDAKWIAPLCRTRLQTWGNVTATLIGCHELYDKYREKFNMRFPLFNPENAASDCESAWQVFSGLAQRET